MILQFRLVIRLGITKKKIDYLIISEPHSYIIQIYNYILIVCFSIMPRYEGTRKLDFHGILAEIIFDTFQKIFTFKS